MKIHRSERHHVLRVALFLAATFISSAQASPNLNLNGQWVGSSQVDGASMTARTMLTLGDPDSGNSSLRIEGTRTCVLKQGNYSTSGGDALSLRFKQANGGEACERLAKGTFTVRAGSTTRSLLFEAIYPSANGGQNLRRGVLARYP